MSKTLAVNGVTLQNPSSGSYERFYRGFVFEDNHWALKNKMLGDHCFAEPEPEADEEPQFYEDLTNSQLIELIAERGLSTASNKKADLIALLREDDEKIEEV